jgi:hypothetical protein
MQSTKRKWKPRNRPDASRPHVCPNPLCQKVLSSPQGLTNHFLHFTTCSNINDSVVALLASAAREVLDHDPETALAVATVDPCADSDSDNDVNVPFDFMADYPENEAAFGLEVPVVPADAIVAAQGVFAGVRVVAHQTGVVHTVADYAEIKLLKIMDDGNVPHYLFKDVLEWAADAKARGYAFCPT